MFLTLPNTFVQAEVIGERINRSSGYGLKIPVPYDFYGHKKGVNWLKNRLEATDKNLEENMKHSFKLFNEIN